MVVLGLALAALAACMPPSTEGTGDGDAGDTGVPSSDGGSQAPSSDAGAVLLGLLPDGGDAARLADGGWDDGYQPAALGACTSGTQVVASLPDVNCLAGLLDGHRIVIATVEWPDGGTSNPNFLQRRLTVKALSSNGTIELGPREVTSATDLASCTARPALAQLGGRYAVAFTRWRPKLAGLGGESFPPAVAVLGQDLRFTLSPVSAGESFIAPSGNAGFLLPVHTWGLSLQASRNGFRLGFAQERALFAPSGGGQVSSGQVLSTTAFPPGPSPDQQAFDLVLLRGGFGAGGWGLAEANDTLVAASRTNTSAEVRVYPGREVAPPYGAIRFVPAVDGGVLVASGTNSGLQGLVATPDGGVDVATWNGSTTVLQQVTAQGTLRAVGSVATTGSLYSSGGRSWLVGGSYSSGSTQLSAVAVDDTAHGLSAAISPSQGLLLLAIEARSDRLRVLSVARDVPFGGLHPESGRLMLTTWCR